MTTLTAPQIYPLARQAGFSGPEAVIATAIALAESGGRSDARGDVSLANAKWGPSIGLWQIRSLNADNGTGRPRDASRLTDPAFNARSAYSIYKGSGWGAWTVYKTGAYMSKMDAAKTAANNPADVSATASTTANGPTNLLSLLQGNGLSAVLNNVQRSWYISIAIVGGIAFIGLGLWLILRSPGKDIKRAVSIATKAA